MREKELHLVTQRNQPIGSIRKCCERCGIMIGKIDYVDEEDNYTKEIAKENGYIRCTDG